MSKHALLSRRDLLKHSAVAAGVSVLGAAETVAAAPAPKSQDQDLIDVALVNGRILTLDDRNTVASALAIRDGRIIEIGRRVARRARTIDLKGATVIPGLIDAHHHIFMSSAHFGYEVRRLEVVTSVPELLQAITDRARSVPAGQFILCEGGWHRRGLVEKRVPTLAELDAAAPNHPVWIAESGRSEPPPGLSNRLGLAFFQAHGLSGDALTGALPRKDATALLRTMITEEDRRRCVNDAIAYALGLGCTMVHDVGNLVPDPSVEATYPFILDLWRAQQLKLRFRIRLNAFEQTGIEGVRARIINNINRLGDDVLRLNGLGEALGDVEPHDADFEPVFVESAKFAASKGWSVHIHSVNYKVAPGDVTENIAHTAAYRKVNELYPLKNLRWSLAHANYITPDLVRQLADMGVGITGEAWKYGSEKLEPMPMGPPFRMLLDAGIHLGGGSDGSSTARFNPWITIYYMTTGKIYSGEVGNPGQSISRVEALKVHTRGSAWHSFDDHHLGSLEVGKLGDLAVLSNDPLTVSDEDLRRITSKMTMLAGRIVHEA
jgi:predicted amidohydrolase YtcJ